MLTDNPRARSGDNADSIDYAKEESERLGRDYGQLNITVEELIAEAGTLPLVIEDDETKGRCATLIKRIRDTTKRADGFREAEKVPFLRRGQGVDQFFFGIIDRLAKRARNNRDGIGDALQARLNDYDNRKLMEEQARRRREAEEAARIQREADEKARKAAAEAEEKRLAAERARKPETAAVKQEAAAVADNAATEANIDLTLATEKAEDAHVATLARPAEIMRQRGNDGTLTTMAREGYAEIEDATKLDMGKLWPYISLDAKEKALRQWAKSVGYREPMTGAAIGFRNKSVVR